MRKKKEPDSKEKKCPINKKLAILSLFLTILIVSVFLFVHFFLQIDTVEFSFKAAIVDQLGENYPSTLEYAQTFNESATERLENAGFNVSYHESKTINVNFYEGLAKYGYGVIILRSHSALRENKPIVDFFTNEEFVEGKYPSELVTAGYYEWKKDKLYCAITPEFIKAIDGVFPKSVVIAMGCDSLHYSTMAQAFIDKGAKLYIGWTRSVSVADSDKATLKLLELLFIENKTINDAIIQCNIYLLTLHPEFGGELDYFPKDMGDKNVWNMVLDSDFQTSSLLEFDKLSFLTITFLAKEGISIRKCCLPFHNVWRRCCKDVL